MTDLERAIVEGNLEGHTVADVMTALGGDVVCRERRCATRSGASPSATSTRFPCSRMPNPGQVAGVLRRTEMMWAYKELSDEHQRLLDRTEAIPRERRGDSVHVEVQVTPEQTQICFHPIREIKVPEQALIALLRRGERVVVPRGFTKVEPGDVLTLITTREHERPSRVGRRPPAGRRISRSLKQADAPRYERHGLRIRVPGRYIFREPRAGQGPWPPGATGGVLVASARTLALEPSGDAPPMADGYRIEKDSLGEMKVPADALYGAQTQRAVENFPISGQRFGRRFIEALGTIKKAAALTNAELGDGGRRRRRRRGEARRRRSWRGSGTTSSSSTSTRPARAPRRT